MRKALGLIFFSAVFGLHQTMAQQIFKGKITYKTFFSGDKQLIEQAKTFMGNGLEIITDGKMFRYFNSGGISEKEIMFEVGKDIYYQIDPKSETISKENFRNRVKNDHKTVVKSTGKVKIIAGVKTVQVEIYRRDKKRAEAWVSDEYLWNLKAHDGYHLQNILLQGSRSAFENKVILGLRMTHPSGKAQIDLLAQEIDTNLSEKAFKLPKFQMLDNTQTKD